jgi:hypothetical protein
LTAFDFAPPSTHARVLPSSFDGAVREHVFTQEAGRLRHLSAFGCAFLTHGTFNMKNSNLFESFIDSPAGRRATTLMLSHTRSVQDIFEEVQREAVLDVASLILGCKYTTQQLSNPVTWADWFTAERRVAGMCLAFLVREKVIGLVQHQTRSGKGTKRYCLPSTHAMTAKSSPRRATIFTLPGSIA